MTERQSLRGFLASVEVTPPLIVTFQFNPETINDSKAVEYPDEKKAVGEDAPRKVYTGGGPRTISFQLQLHGLEQGTQPYNPSAVDNGIATELAKLRSFMYPRGDDWGDLFQTDESEGKWSQSPPNALFGFGTRILKCQVTSMDITETQFNSALTPVRAEVDVSLTVIEDRESALYQLDTQRRNQLALLGLQQVQPF